MLSNFSFLYSDNYLGFLFGGIFASSFQVIAFAFSSQAGGFLFLACSNISSSSSKILIVVRNWKAVTCSFKQLNVKRQPREILSLFSCNKMSLGVWLPGKNVSHIVANSRKYSFHPTLPYLFFILSHPTVPIFYFFPPYRTYIAFKNLNLKCKAFFILLRR